MASPEKAISTQSQPLFVENYSIGKTISGTKETARRVILFDLRSLTFGTAFLASYETLRDVDTHSLLEYEDDYEKAVELVDQIGEMPPELIDNGFNQLQLKEIQRDAVIRLLKDVRKNRDRHNTQVNRFNDIENTLFDKLDFTS